MWSNDSYGTAYSDATLPPKENDEQRREKSNVIDGRAETSMEVGTSDVQRFGEYADTHDWIECTSKSFPGKTYFFNVRSACSTWCRPVSRNIRLPRIQRRLMDNALPYHLPSESIIVSEDEENYDSTPDQNSSPPNYNINAEAELSSTARTVNTGGDLSFHKNNDRAKNSKPYSVPTLRQVRPHDLTIKAARRRRKTVRDANGNVSVNADPRKKLRPKKIVFEMYGTKTVSYDPVEPELPPGVKRSNLSDTSVASTTWRDETTIRNFSNINLHDLDFKTGGLCLSESSTSAACGSSSAYSSTN